MLVQWTDDNDNIDTSFADNAASKRVNAIGVTIHRSSQKQGLYDKAENGRTSNRPVKSSMCFICGINDDHWADFCPSTNLDWDEAARLRFSAYRNHINKKHKDSKLQSYKQKKINKATSADKKVASSEDAESGSD